jgi:anti-sigma factor RsiW
VKCSLLTLSTFIDGALPPDRGAEVDAHLVGCPRCTAGAATLREEKGRIAQLARVHVQPESAQTLLEQVGISGAMPEQLQRERPGMTVAPESRPWLSGGAGAALPWSPRRPSAPPPRGDPFPFTEEQIVPTVRPDVQPDLPFDAASPEVEAIPANPSLGIPPAPWTDTAEHASPPLEPWEAAIPAYADADMVALAWPPPVERPGGDPGAVAPPPAPPPPPLAEEAGRVLEHPLMAPAVPPPPAGPPQRLEAASGPRALFDRARDAVAVRLALSRRDVAAADAVDVVHQAAPGRRLPPPLAGFEAPATTARRLPTPPRGAAEAPPRATAAAERMVPAPLPARGGRIADAADDRPMELTGFTDTPIAAPSRASSIRALRERADTDDADADDHGGDDGSWNAFGAAAFRGETTPATEASAARAPRRPLGRHSRAVQRQSVGIGIRLRALVGAALSSVRGGSAQAAPATRGAGGVVPGGGTAAAPRTRFSFDHRVALAIGGVVAIFLVAFLIGHVGTHSPTATRVTPSTAASVAPHSAAASASAPTAPPATAGRPTTTAPLPAMQTFGKGGSGFQVTRMRYGVFDGSQRIVVDLGATSGTATGEPLTTIGFSGTTTMLVTFNGTIPAGSLAAPPAGGVVTSITRVPSTAGTTTYRFTLSRAAKPVAFYLTGPLRFVLDLH